MYTYHVLRRHWLTVFRWYRRNAGGQLGPFFDFYAILVGGALFLFLGVPFLLRGWPYILVAVGTLETLGLMARSERVPADKVRRFVADQKKALEGRKGREVEVLRRELDSLLPSPQDLRLPTLYRLIRTRDRVTEFLGRL